MDKGVCANTILLYYIFVIPNFLNTVLPISFFISILFVLNDMQSHNEIVALRASGFTVLRITRMFWAIALVLAASVAFFNAYILPVAANEIKTINDSIEYDYQKRTNQAPTSIGSTSFLTFFNQKDNRIWFISKFSFYTNTGSFLTISELNNDGSEKKRIEAREVFYNKEANEWVFENGKKWYFDESTNAPTSFKKLQINQKTFCETPSLMQNAQKQLKNLNFSELKELLNIIPADNKNFLGHRIKYYSILSNPVVFFIIVLLAVPFSLKGVRSNQMIGISEAIILLFLFFILGSLCKLLGSQSILHPFVAAWLPNLLMLILGSCLYKQLAPK